MKEENKKDAEKEINDFLFKALNKYGRNALVLFEYAEENSINVFIMKNISTNHKLIGYSLLL